MTYCVTKSSRSGQHSLVDRGANGEVAGSDLRLIENHPDRKVDICGIENYQISAIPLVTTAGLTTTIIGEGMLIMQQHSCHGKNKIMHSSHQTKYCKNIVYGFSIKVDGRQYITPWINVNPYIYSRCIALHSIASLYR